MIPVRKYSVEFEEQYLAVVNKNIHSKTQERIIRSCKKFLPDDFFSGNTDELFKELVLAPFDKLKSAEKYIEEKKMNIMKIESFCKKRGKKIPMTKLYRVLHDTYKVVADSEKNKMSVRVRIVKNTGLTVCPYCNRDYINCRADNVSGAQLDHFFSKSKMPIFSVCLYNLVPVCSNCNRIKSKQEGNFASPFDESIDWKEDIKFSFVGNSLADIQINIDTNEQLKTNIEKMRIHETYQIHKLEVLELIEQQEIYNDSQKDEFKDVLAKTKITDLEIKKIIFGPELTEDRIKGKPLGKMIRDLHKQMNIY